MRAIGYVRTSTEEQETGLEVQRQAIEAECERRGWTLQQLAEDAGFSGGNLERPSIQALLRQMRPGDVLIVARLDRLSRSIKDHIALLERAKREGWAVIALDLGVDMTTPAGRMVANVMAVMAEYERELIGQRIRDALAVKKAAGVKLGRPSGVPAQLRQQITEKREAGTSLQQIANELNAEGVPTSMGGKRWWPSSVRAVLLS
jgi:DNA invertase Pin-like site-specific DNA recombinase